MKPEAEE
jgi:hypothetical protein